MTHLTAWLAPGLLRPLGMTLLHFVWQGAGLAALAAAAFALTRNPRLRYTAGVLLLVLMVAAPLVTFQILRERAASLTAMNAEVLPSAVPVDRGVKVAAAESTDKGLAAEAADAPGPLVWLVELWFLGVVLFSVRTLGGIAILERLRRKSATPLSHTLLAGCHELQWAMRLERVVRYCESAHIGAPAVLGWFRPVVMLPVNAITGLSEAQLRAVIAHELAHIKRYDAFVNLFQIAAESVLFYHPAVWWLNKRIRAERENCCDDAAIAVCGSPVEYARALTLMEEWRKVPEFAMAANSHPLAARIKRLLGAPALESGLRTAGLSAGLVCLAAALLAGNAFLGVARTQADSQTPAAQASQAERPSVIVIQAEGPKTAKTPQPAAAPDPGPQPAQTAQASQAPQASPSPQPAPKSSYIDSLKAEGIDNVSLDDLIALKVQGVTADYIHEIHAAGLKPSVEELIGMKVQGVTPEYIRQMKDLALKTDLDNLIGMKVQGVTPEYVKEMRAAVPNLNSDELIGMKVQGITPDYVRQMKEMQLDTSAENLIGMKVQGVTPDYVKEMRAAVPNLKSDELIGMKVQGITPAYLKQMHDLGLKAGADEAIGMKVQGVTPEYIQGIRATGLNPSVDELIGMRVQGVTPEYIKSLQAAGLKFDVDEIIGAKVQGISPEFIEKARSHGFKDLSLDKLIALKHSGVLD